MNAVFDEWNASALKKAIMPRSLSLDRFVGDARLNIAAEAE